MKPLIFSIKDIADIIIERRNNEFDSRIAIVGTTGDGKSTLITKIFYRLPGYEPWKHQVYSRDEIMKLLDSQIKGLCQDDEGINSGYKRDFQNKGQQDMIKFLTNNRDNLNTYATALPNFFSLDKDLRDLFFLVIHVLERGIAVIHLPIEGTFYSTDKWDSKNNAKIEEKWIQQRKKNPLLKPNYQKLSTFIGYIFWEKLTPLQEALYKEIKKYKKDKVNKKVIDNNVQQKTFIDKMYEALINGKLTRDTAITYCIMENEKWSSVNIRLNQMLKDKGILDKTATDFFIKPSNPSIHNSVNDEIKQLLPNL